MSKQFKYQPVKTVPRAVETPKNFRVNNGTPSIYILIGNDSICIDADRCGWNREMYYTYHNYYNYEFYW